MTTQPGNEGVMGSAVAIGFIAGLLVAVGVLLPLLLLAVSLFVAYGRRARGVPRPRVPAVATTVIVVALLVAAAATVFFHQDPRTYETAFESGSTSDVVTGLEALIMIALASTAVAVGWALSAPRGGRGGRARGRTRRVEKPP